MEEERPVHMSNLQREVGAESAELAIADRSEEVKKAISEGCWGEECAAI